jgi:hypothetical protein
VTCKAVNTGGGVLVAVNAEIPITRRLDLQPANTELLVTDLNKSNSYSVIFYTFYHPPNSTSDVLQQLNGYFQNNLESSCILLVGDFNLPIIQWSSERKVPINTGSPMENVLRLGGQLPQLIHIGPYIYTSLETNHTFLYSFHSFTVTQQIIISYKNSN